MTGGGTGRCLQTNEASGIGEGWSDAMANWLEKVSGCPLNTLNRRTQYKCQTSAAVPDYEFGVYVNGQNTRHYPYSTSTTTNPLRYSSLQNLYDVHGKLT
jgi:extracellular elastinolytic metalloproteinase